MAVIRVIDFEATGDSPHNDEHGLVEIGYTDLISTDTDLVGTPTNWEVGDTISRLCSPGVPIPPETSAVHHIIDADVAGLPNWKPLLKGFVTKARQDGVIALAAHSADHEQLWFHPNWLEPPIPFVCTYKAALRLWKDAPLHSNMGLRYWRTPRGLIREKALPAHRAGPDSYVTAFHLRDMLEEGAVLDDMVAWTKEPALTLRCRIGDYRNGGKGTPWEDVETSYLHWIAGKDFDEDTIFTVRHHLELRRQQEAEERESEALNEQFRANGLAEPHQESFL